jgi:aminopeptidase N
MADTTNSDRSEMRVTMTARPRRRSTLSVLVSPIPAVLISAILIPALVGAPPATTEEPTTIGTDGYVHISPHGEVLGRDAYYPRDGNGGYDVTKYDVALKVQAFRTDITATSRITATATQKLTQFNLDLQGLEVTSVRVDGRNATFAREGDHELVITPTVALAKNAEFLVEVDYRGCPTYNEANGHRVGWRWHSGGAVAAGLPHSARTWMPVNDTSVDKAQLTITADLPSTWSMVANGVEESVVPDGARHRITWSERTPVAPSGMLLAVGGLTVDKSTLANGKPLVNAYYPDSEAAKELGARIPEIIDVLTRFYGNYSMSTAGGVFLPKASEHSLFAQGHPVFGENVDINEVVQGVAAQWWGNQVTIKTWPDHLMTESFARYSVWLWDETKNQVDLDARYKKIVEASRADTTFWSPKLKDVGVGNELSAGDKGVLMVHALRKRMGDKAFKELVEMFCLGNIGWNQAWSDWQLFVEAVSRTGLPDFFAAWLDSGTIPPDSQLFPKG